MLNRLFQGYLKYSFILVLIVILLAPIFSYGAMDIRRTGGNVKANGIQIEYETFGDPSSPPLLLIFGLGGQMILWDEEFCKQLVDKGFFVIRFDNRDVGLSTKFEKESYTLNDMAGDAVGLMDALGIKKAHICGASMGASITQIIGYRHPSKVLSLILIMGPAGIRGKPEAWKFLSTPFPEEREANIELNVRMWKVFWGTFPFDEDYIRKLVAAAYDRAFYPKGVMNQSSASMRTRIDRSSITAPTLVIHGAEDPLVPVENGKNTAQSIPGAKLLIIDKMGHSLPKEVWPQVIDAIVEHTSK